MSKKNITPSNNYNYLVSRISEKYTQGKENATAAVNQHIIETYWKVGEHIVEFEQDGKQRAEYGSGLLERLSKDLSILHGKGFSVSNIQRMRQLYDEYPIYATLSHKLSWSYYVEFLNIPEPYHLSESELENRIIGSLQQFLLELGKGFAFVGRQYRITLGNRHFRVDLVFYHRILKCFVLIDLKKEEAGYEDVGQMNMYMGYFEAEENTEGDNPPIGIVLSKNKDELLVKYAMNKVNSQLFVSKYQLYLPDREELRALIEKQIAINH